MLALKECIPCHEPHAPPGKCLGAFLSKYTHNVHAQLSALAAAQLPPKSAASYVHYEWNDRAPGTLQSCMKLTRLGQRPGLVAHRGPVASTGHSQSAIRRSNVWFQTANTLPGSCPAMDRELLHACAQKKRLTPLQSVQFSQNVRADVEGKTQYNDMPPDNDPTQMTLRAIRCR